MGSVQIYGLEERSDRQWTVDSTGGGAEKEEG